MAPDILVWIIKQKRADGSSAFSVDFEGTIFECLDEDAAEAMAEAFMDAINNHTNQSADVMR